MIPLKCKSHRYNPLFPALGWLPLFLRRNWRLCCDPSSREWPACAHMHLLFHLYFSSTFLQFFPLPPWLLSYWHPATSGHAKHMTALEFCLLLPTAFFLQTFARVSSWVFFSNSPYHWACSERPCEIATLLPCPLLPCLASVSATELSDCCHLTFFLLISLCIASLPDCMIRDDCFFLLL